MLWYSDLIIDMAMAIVTASPMLHVGEERISSPHRACREGSLSCLKSRDFCPMATSPVLPILHHLGVSDKVKRILLEALLRDTLDIMVINPAESVGVSPCMVSTAVPSYFLH